MKNRMTALNITLFILSATIMFCVKHNFQKHNRDLVQLNRALTSEQKTYQVLKAEYAYLSNPQRLVVLADKYLDCKQQTANNFDYIMYQEIYGQDSSIFKLANSAFKHN